MEKKKDLEINPLENKLTDMGHTEREGGGGGGGGGDRQTETEKETDRQTD